MLDQVRFDRRDLLTAALAAGTSSILSPAFAQPSKKDSRGAKLDSIIDVHAHAILPSWYRWLASKSAPAAPTIEGGFPIPTWSSDSAIALMDENRIQAMVLSNGAGTKDMSRSEAIQLSRSMNEELAEIVARNPRRFGAFAVLPLQDIDAALVELTYALDKLHLDGVALLTSFEGRYFGDPFFDPLLAELDKRKATVFVHPHAASYTKEIQLKVNWGTLEFVFDTTRAITGLIASGVRKRYPNFRYIAAHGGGALPFLADRIAWAVSHGTGYATRLSHLEAMQDLQSIHLDLALTTSKPAFAAIKRFASPDKILMGFDQPFNPPAAVGPAIAQITGSGAFSPTELKLIGSGNAMNILPKLSSRLSA